MHNSVKIYESTPRVIEATVDDLSTDGRGVIHVDHRAYFMSGGLPGDRVSAALKTAARPASAVLLRRLQDSPHRVTHPCPHSAECPGSVWGSLFYSEQLKYKQALVQRTLQKAVGEIAVLPTVPSPLEWNYRNRITLTVWPQEKGFEIGYQTESRQLTGVPVLTCLLGDVSFRDCIEQISDLFRSAIELSADSLPRRIQIHKTSKGAGLLLVFPGTIHDSQIRTWKKHLQRIDAPGGIWFAAGTQAGIIDHRKPVLSTDHASMAAACWLGHELEIHPTVFTQANSKAAESVHVKLKTIAMENRWSAVWDLYGGYGALGCAAAANGASLSVLELTRNSETAMNILAAAAGVKNPRFIAGDLIKTLPRCLPDIGKNDVVILDPPRSGAHAEVIAALGTSRARDILYLSCNPARLGRDLARLKQAGFRITEIEPYDFFPQTPRIEVLARLKRE